MSNQNFLATISAPSGADLDTVARALSDYLKDRFQNGEDSYDDAALKAEEAEIRQLHAAFFDYSLQWLKAQIEKTRGERPHPDAMPLKKRARDMLGPMQNNVLGFSLCALRISRSIIMVRHGIKAANMKSVGLMPGKTPIKWTSDAGVLLARHKKRGAEIEDFMKRRESAQAIFTKLEPLLANFTTGLNGAFAKEDADRFFSSFRSSLRLVDFDRATTVLAAIKTATPRKGGEALHETLAATGHEIIALLQANSSTLRDEEGKLFFTPTEMKMVGDGMDQEMVKIRGFVVKYNLPYMEYKLDSLGRLRDKLQLVISLDSIIHLYCKLIAGMGSSLKGMAEVRTLESEVLNKITYLQTSQFPEIEKIAAEANKIVAEYLVARDDYQNNLDVLVASGDGVNLDIALES